MAERPLHAPWRMDYIRSLEHPKEGECFLCTAASASTEQQQRDCLVLWSTDHTVVLINRYPYTNGHLLIAPKPHIAELEQLPPEIANDLTQQTTRALLLLKKCLSPQGFNIGINLGRCAGAGLPGHIHQHIVPRWSGDTNFMSVIGEVRVVPQAMSQLYDELKRCLK